MSQDKGNDLRLDDPEASTKDTVTSPRATIEDKLKDHIAKRVTAWFGEPVLAVEDEIQAIITTETTNARIDELETTLTKFNENPAAIPTVYEKQRNRILLDRLDALQKEQK